MLLHVRGNGLYFQTGRNRNAQTHAGTICSEEDVVDFKGGRSVSSLNSKEAKKDFNSLWTLYEIHRCLQLFFFFFNKPGGQLKYLDADQYILYVPI